MTMMTTTYTKEEGDDKDNDGEVYVDGTARRQLQQWSLHRKTVGWVSQLSNDMGLGLSDRVLKYVCVRSQYPVG